MVHESSFPTSSSFQPVPVSQVQNTGSSSTFRHRATALVTSAIGALPSGIPVKWLDLTVYENAARVEKHAFNALVYFGAAYCLGSYKLALVAGAALYATLHLKQDEIMAKVSDFTKQYSPLGEHKLGLLSLFVPDAEADEEDAYAPTTNAMLALMITYVASPWLGAHTTAGFFGFKVAQHLYNLSQGKNKGKEKVEIEIPVISVIPNQGEL